ncbi:MAG: alpha/beta fold hydrolase [Pseudomonadota bacterium]|nr:alpha/beta fold hydrolase [Pseudomonadota bacterium]
MKPFHAMLLAFSLLLPVAVAPAQDGATDATGTAVALLDAMDAGDYAAAEAMMSAEMAAAVPAARLQAVWESLPAQAGPANGRGEITTSAADGGTLVMVPLHYANAELVAKVAIAADGKISGFLVQPAQPAAPPPPAAGAGFSERDIVVGQGERALPATLALPDGAGPFPAVVLVHGSGPHDRNETIGPNHPFLDIARGLAAQGVAVLRYEKRTKAQPQAYTAEGSLTIDTETTDDAVLAVQALHALSEVDDARVFVFGHSQGGMMAPRIAMRAIEADAPVAGLVLFAAPARKLLDIMLEQGRRMAVLDDQHTSEQEAAKIASFQQQMRALRAGDDLAAAQSPMSLPASYWRSTDAVDPVAEAVAVDLPMLVLQGARDIQVVDADWQLWKGAFHDDPEVAFKLYPTLNHLGIAGEGDANLAEYSVAGHVDAQLIDDAAAWILAQ